LKLDGARGLVDVENSQNTTQSSYHTTGGESVFMKTGHGRF